MNKGQQTRSGIAGLQSGSTEKLLGLLRAQLRQGEAHAGGGRGRADHVTQQSAQVRGVPAARQQHVLTSTQHAGVRFVAQVRADEGQAGLGSAQHRQEKQDEDRSP